MWDLLYVAVMIALVAVASLFVIACDKIIGSDDEALADQHREQTPLGRSEVAS
jgi:hypothetical protein